MSFGTVAGAPRWRHAESSESGDQDETNNRSTQASTASRVLHERLHAESSGSSDHDEANGRSACGAPKSWRVRNEWQTQRGIGSVLDGPEVGRMTYEAWLGKRGELIAEQLLARMGA